MDPLVTAGVAASGLAALGGLGAMLLGIRRAPMDEATALAGSATALATSATGQAAQVRAHNLELIAEIQALTAAHERALRDWAHDREENRQLRVANEALQDENARLSALQNGGT